MMISCSNDLEIKNIIVYPETVAIEEGDSMRINAVINFSGGKYNEPNLIKLKWSSDNQDIVTVDTTGYIHAIAIGSANVIVECENKSAKCSITVLEDTTSTANDDNITV